VKVRRMVEGQETSLQKENAKIITKPKTGSSSFPEGDASVDFDSKIWEAHDEVNSWPYLRLSMFRLPSSYPRNRLTVSLALTLVTPLLIGGQTGPSRILQPRYSQQAIASGARGALLIELEVKEGFKVAKRPAPKLQLNPNTRFEVVVGGFNESVPAKDADYFGGFRPLELKIAPAKTTEAGKYSLEGKLTYFYCSEKEKYCSRSVEALAIPVEVAKK
jgi:hypothetical protein